MLSNQRSCINTVTLAAFLIASGCGGDERGDPAAGAGFGGGNDGGGTDSGLSTAGESGANSDGGSASADGPSGDTEDIYFDVGGGMATGPGPGKGDTGCTKVDILFVIDNSGSMADEQQKLIANFPGFAEEIQSTLGEVDGYNVGVVTSDDYWNVFASPGINADAMECRVLGGLVTANPTQACTPYAAGNRFMTEADDLATRFACAANVGDQGIGLEQMGGAAVNALLPSLSAPGGCNDGFLRDDALLILVLITDEDDDIESLGDPTDWYTSVVSAKFNEPDNIVVLSLIWDDSGGNPNGCVVASDENTGTSIAEFTNMFTHGSVGSLCVDSYQQFFSDAIGVIDVACDEFEPPRG